MKIRAPQIRTPELLNNLYRDLRDRRLLFPAAALLVALIAVPVALSSSSPTTTPPAPAPVEAGSGPAAATEPAVLAEELGMTAYQKRLNQLQTKNPFKRQYMATPTSAQPEASSSTDSPSSSTASSTEDSAYDATEHLHGLGRRPARRARPHPRSRLSRPCTCSSWIWRLGHRVT